MSVTDVQGDRVPPQLCRAPCAGEPRKEMLGLGDRGVLILIPLEERVVAGAPSPQALPFSSQCRWESGKVTGEN